MSSTLADLASAAGLTAADIAHLAGISEATVSRAWDNADWTRVSTGTLFALIPVVPGLLDEVHAATTGQRFKAVTSELAGVGVNVNRAGVDELVTTGTREETIGSALAAAATILRGDVDEIARTLARFWGRDQDQVLGQVFTPGGLVVDPAPLLLAGAAAAGELLPRSGNSFHAFMAHAVLQHHTARSTGAVCTDAPTGGARQTAFLRRSTTIGLIISTGDLDLVDRYASDVARSPLAGRIEDWAHATYNRDVRPDPSWWVPRSVVLHRTAHQVLREIGDYPPAYVAYLVEVWLPRALARDPQFAGRALELAAALRQRRDELPTTDHIDKMIRTIERTA